MAGVGALADLAWTAGRMRKEHDAEAMHKEQSSYTSGRYVPGAQCANTKASGADTDASWMSTTPACEETSPGQLERLSRLGPLQGLRCVVEGQFLDARACQTIRREDVRVPGAPRHLKPTRASMS